MRIDHENTLLQYLSSGINLFVGAGFSTEAKNKDKLSLPVGSQLSDEIIDYFNLQEYTNTFAKFKKQRKSTFLFFLSC